MFRVLQMLTTWLVFVGVASATQATVTIDLDKPGAEIPDLMYGAALEESNKGIDGGLYAELLQNRSFEDQRIPEGTSEEKNQVTTPEITTRWRKDGATKWTHGWPAPNAKDPVRDWKMTGGEIALANVGALAPGNPTYVTVTIEKAPKDTAARLSNLTTFPIQRGQTFAVSFFARARKIPPGVLLVGLTNGKGDKLGVAKIQGVTNKNWQRYSAIISATGTEALASFFIDFLQECEVNIDQISLMSNVWKGSPFGLRADLIEHLQQLKPDFLRFPAGDSAGGMCLANRYRWFETIGNVAVRPGHYNAQFGFRATDGFGYHEFLELCESLKCRAVYVANAGFSAGTSECPSEDQITTYIDETVNAVEYAVGSSSTKWGQVRAKNGHPAPFHLTHVAIGNEINGDFYRAQFPKFVAAIHAKFPKVTCIMSCGNGRASVAYVKGIEGLEMVDERFTYLDSNGFFDTASVYDSTPRKQTFTRCIGEYSCRIWGNAPNWQRSLAEAAFLLGVERNSDVVSLVNGAPLFTRMGKDNKPPLGPVIFDGDDSAVRSSYLIFQQFTHFKPDMTLDTNLAVTGGTQPALFGGGCGLGTANASGQFKDFTLTGLDGQELYQADFDGDLRGWKIKSGTKWKGEKGVLTQPEELSHMIWLENRSYDTYALNVKVCRIGGKDGFVIPMAIQGTDAPLCLNLGAVGNTKHYLSYRGQWIGTTNGKLEDKRWYDIRIEVDRTTVRAFIDKQKIIEMSRTSARFFALAGHDKKQHDIVVKLVNATPDATPTTISIKAVGKKIGNAKGVVISAEPGVDNDLEGNTSKRVEAKKLDLRAGANEFTVDMKPFSFVAFRLKYFTAEGEAGQ